MGLPEILSAGRIFNAKIITKGLGQVLVGGIVAGVRPIPPL